MKVLITGGAGFVGQRLIQKLLDGDGLGFAQTDGVSVEREAIDQIVSLDQAEGRISDSRVRYLTGDLTDRSLLESALTADTSLVFHLAAVVSGTAESDFELGMRVNLDGTRQLLERCRELAAKPRFVFASTVGVFGGDMPSVIRDDTTPMPQGSYGIQKLMCEHMVQDFSRKGFIQGCSVRLPTVIVRPGKPNGAASSFASAIIREPLAGREMTLPVALSTEMWSSSPEMVVENMVHAAQLAPSAWGLWRSVNLPGRVVGMTEAVNVLGEIAGASVRALVKVEPDENIVRLVSTWPASFETKRAEQMGFQSDPDFLSMLRHYVSSNPEAIKVDVKL